MAVPIQKVGESDQDFAERLKTYHQKERLRDSKRKADPKRKKYLLEYERARRERLKASPEYVFYRAEREKAARKKAEERQKLQRMHENARRYAREKLREQNDPEYAMRMRALRAERARKSTQRKKEFGEDSYYRKLVRQRGHAAYKRVCKYGRGHGPFAGEAGDTRFLRALEQVFMYGVILFENSEVEKERPAANYSDVKLSQNAPYSMSKYEKIISDILTDAGIAFEREKEFSWLVNACTGCLYRCDFYLPDKNLVIEYNGPQHYLLRVFNKDTEALVRRQLMDDDKYAQIAQAGVGLLVIDYTFRTKKRIASLLIEKGVLNG